MTRMLAIVHAAAARLPVADAAAGLPTCTARLVASARTADYARARYAAGTLPSRFQIA